MSEKILKTYPESKCNVLKIFYENIRSEKSSLKNIYFCVVPLLISLKGVSLNKKAFRFLYIIFMVYS